MTTCILQGMRVPTKVEIMIEMVLNTENKPREADLQQTARREMLRQHLSPEEGGEGGGAARGGGASQELQ